MKKLLTLTALGTIMIASNAGASGFHLKEQSISAMGNAFAGATAGAEDVSYSYFNPAGITRQKGTQMSFGGTLIAPRSKAKTAVATGIPAPTESGYTDNIVHAAVAPNFYVSHQINDQWTAGFSLNSPFGMITMYDEDWAGRFHGTKSDVKTLTATPMIAYKPTDKLSIGAGLQMQYVRAKLKNSVMLPLAPGVFAEDRTKLQGDTFDIGYQVGALYEMTEQTRFGVGYRSQIKHKLKGDISFDKFGSVMDQDINARLTTPASLTAGVYHDINARWSVMAEIGRTYWSSFEDLDIIGDGGTGGKPIHSITQEKWKDTTFYALGASYRINEQWKLRAGMAVDQSAVGEQYRTPRIPDSDRLWYSSGVEYKLDNHVTINAGYTYIRAEKGKVHLDGTTGGVGTLQAKYENDVHMVGLGLNYSF